MKTQIWISTKHSYPHVARVLWVYVVKPSKSIPNSCFTFSYMDTDMDTDMWTSIIIDIIIIAVAVTWSLVESLILHFVPGRFNIASSKKLSQYISHRRSPSEVQRYVYIPTLSAFASFRCDMLYRNQTLFQSPREAIHSVWVRCAHPPNEASHVEISLLVGKHCD